MKRKIKKFVKDHKTEIAIVGAATIATAFLLKKNADLKKEREGIEIAKKIWRDGTQTGFHEGVQACFEKWSEFPEVKAAMDKAFPEILAKEPRGLHVAHTFDYDGLVKSLRELNL